MFSAKSRLQRLPIRTRLTLRYVVVLAFTLLVYGILVNVVLVWNAWALLDRDLTIAAQQVNARLEIRPEIPLADQPTLLPDTSHILSPDFLIQVIDPDGAIVARSANFGARELPRQQGVLTQALAGKPTFTTLEWRGLWLRVYLLPLTESGQVIGVLWIARSMETLGNALDRLQMTLIGVGLGALILAGVWGWRLARGALRPVDEMTRIARAIEQSQDLTKRVPYRGPADELGRLAFTFNEMLASLQTAHERTANALAAQRRFAADASHELRTPLTSLRGNVGILRHALERWTGASSDAAGILRDLDDELARLSRLVDDLLVLARADAKQPIAKQPLDWSEIVRKMFQRIQNQHPPVALALDCQDRVNVVGNADHLSQLFFILLDNAMAYTPDDGRIAISLKRDENDATLSVRDTGIGVAAEDLPHIFERFYRTRAARVQRGDGAGLGLAIARWIVEEHAGQISASSEAGQGTVFAVQLPLAPTAVSSS